MKCVYRELKESITDASFPTLPIVIEKSYFYQTEANQYVDISSFIPADLRFNQLKIEAIVKPVSLDYSQTQPAYICHTRGDVSYLSSIRNYLHAVVGDNILNGSSNPASVDTVLISDGALNTVTIGETSQVGQTAVSTSKVTTAKLLGAAAMLSTIKIKEVKLTDQANNIVIADFVPVTFNGVGVVYDRLSGTVLYPSSGTLGID